MTAFQSFDNRFNADLPLEFKFPKKKTSQSSEDSVSGKSTTTTTTTTNNLNNMRRRYSLAAFGKNEPASDSYDSAVQTGKDDALILETKILPTFYYSKIVKHTPVQVELVSYVLPFNKLVYSGWLLLLLQTQPLNCTSEKCSNTLFLVVSLSILNH